jgi:hypothetical protein
MKTGSRVIYIDGAARKSRRPRGTITAVSAKTVWVEWDVGLIANYPRRCGHIRLAQ